MLTRTFYEEINPIAQIAPQSSSSNILSAAIDMKNIYRLAAIINVGVIASTGTFDGKFVQAVTSGGTYKDITGKAITQLTQAGGDSNPGKPLCIDLRADELDLANGYRYVKLSLTPATAASLLSANIFAFSDYLPVPSSQWKQTVL